MKKPVMVRLDDVQTALGVSWPLPHRFIDRYGYSKEIVDDPELGQVVPEKVAIAVITKFREESTVGRHRDVHNYPQLDVSRRFGNPKTQWRPPEET